MIGHMNNDAGISTIQTSAFNYDGMKRDILDFEEARSILDFDILVKPCKTQEGIDIPGLNYLEKSTDSSIIPSPGVGDRFQPYDNRKFFDHFTMEVMPKIPELKLETVATLHGCGTALITTNMGDDFHIDGDESPNKFRVMFCNTNNGTAALQLGFTTVRIVCMNTLAMARNEVNHDKNAFKIHHTESAEEKVGNAVKTIYARLKEMTHLKQRIDALASKSVDAMTVQRVLDRVYPIDAFPSDRDIVSAGRTRTENIRAEVIRQFESGETAQTFSKDNGWKLLNALNFRIFNPISEKNKRTDKADIAYRGAMGDVANKVYRMMTITEEELGLRIAA